MSHIQKTHLIVSFFLTQCGKNLWTEMQLWSLRFSHFRIKVLLGGVVRTCDHNGS